MDWKRIGDAQDTASTILRNWLQAVMGPNYTAEHLNEIDKSRENYPEYWTRNDMQDNRGTRHR